ncbi:sensor histidine kinase [Schumannella soli]|uniref:ATP-binding protein n=1 Tax=Schumannella soli TaxID=2590779 RepID=A0A506Y5S2_9MICO|nr:hypothetical protein [Schumannella soli]TPW75789.1 hypothetical protein FJ657_07955 [Schumannella soli]
MRVAVLPREVAAGVITDTISRMVWATGAVNLLLDVPIVIEAYMRLGIGHEVGPPLVLLALVLALLLLAAWRSRPLTSLLFLIVGAVAVAAFQLVVLRDLPDAAAHYNFLLNRPAVALGLVAIAPTTPLIVSSWLLAGWATTSGISAVVAAVGDHPFSPGFGPTMMMIIGTGLCAVLAAIQRRARSRVPNFDELEAETQALTTGADLARRTTAVVHDTVLNDLAIVMNGSDVLDERTRARLRDDLDTLTSADWLTTSHHVPADDADAVLRNRITRMVTDFQWRGLSVRVTGGGTGIYRLDPEAADALLDATRAALENVLKHSGTTDAEIVSSSTEEMISVMVIDQGVGFDASAVADDRLGIRESMSGRLERVGGRLDVWSTRGAGTSVVLTVPVLDVVVPNEPSHHRLIGQSALSDGEEPVGEHPREALGDPFGPRLDRERREAPDLTRGGDDAR